MRAEREPASSIEIDDPDNLRLRTYKAATHTRLEEMILELQLLPGTRLVEADLAARFGISKTPIREAFLMLQADGLVELVPHVGARVTWLTIDELEELHFLQDAIEIPSLAVVAERLSSSDLSAVDQRLAGARRHRKQRDSAGYYRDVVDIHEILFGLVKSARISRLIRSVMGHERRYEVVFIHQFDDAWDLEHEVLTSRVDFLRRGDLAGAGDAVRRGHAQQVELAKSRIGHPLVAPYLSPALRDATRPISPLARDDDASPSATTRAARNAPIRRHS
jgi:DNA-binding GntR family transcriptional regulator